MTALAPYVRILGRGPGRARNLTQEEARAAMEIVLVGEADPVALGGLLMLMRYRGEDAAEIAGFTAAMRADIGALGLRPAVDWPSYAAGRSRGLPFFLLAARLVARAGLPVLLHGWNSHQNPVADIRRALPFAGITQASSPQAAAEALAQDGIAYLPLEVFAPKLLELLQLREVLGLRSCLNTVARMVNPGGAVLTVQGVFHPSYRALQRDAAELLGDASVMTIKGGGGEFERHPGKPLDCVSFGQAAGVHPALMEVSTRLAEGPQVPADPASLTALWSGEITDAFAEATITGTAALVLQGAGRASTGPEAQDLAQSLWDGRLTPGETRMQA